MFQTGRIDFQTEQTSKVWELNLKYVITDTCRDSARLSLCKELAFYLPFPYKEIN